MRDSKDIWFQNSGVNLAQLSGSTFAIQQESGTGEQRHIQLTTGTLATRRTDFFLPAYLDGTVSITDPQQLITKAYGDATYLSGTQSINNLSDL